MIQPSLVISRPLFLFHLIPTEFEDIDKTKIKQLRISGKQWVLKNYVYLT